MSLRLFLLFLLATLLIGNLNALVDMVLHPEIPYFDKEHFIVGGITASLSVILFCVLLVYMKRLEKALHNSRLVAENLKTSENKFRELFLAESDAILIFDAETLQFIDVNDAALDLYGYSKEEFMKLKVLDISTELEKTADSVAKTRGGKIERIPVRYHKKKDGTVFPVEISPGTFMLGNRQVLCGIIRDITERKKMEKELDALLITDELTGLHNRRGFFTLVQHHLKIADRLKKGIFMLYTDMDDLKWINDSFGHKEGDAALIDIANVLKTNFRESDIIARLGGDEFVVLPVGTTGDCIEIITARLKKALEIHNSKSSRSYNLSASVGVVYYDPESPCSIDEMLTQADKLMYEQKMRKQSP